MRFTIGRTFLAALAALMIADSTADAAGGRHYHVEYAFQGAADGGNPGSSLLDYQGQLYGTTDLWHESFGAVYAFRPTTGVLTPVYGFNNHGGPFGNGLLNVGGKLYGTVFNDGVGYGSIFSLDPATGQETVLHTFQGGADSCVPVGDLIKVGSLIYGLTQGCDSPGTVYSIDPQTGAFATVYAFKSGDDGLNPYGGLTDIGGLLFGTTQHGGSNGCGTAFQVDPATGAEKVLHVFGGGADGACPKGALIKVDGMLYGTTQIGGGGDACNSGCGTIFSLDPATGAEKVRYAFKSGRDGFAPIGHLTKVGSTLYGVTEYGGASAIGAIFTFDLRNNTETIVHAFRGGTDGSDPSAGLTLKDNRLFGTTYTGGGSAECTGGCGTLFSIRP